MEYILTFKSTQDAIRAEKLLLAKDLPVMVMPLPAKIRAGCGLCLRLTRNELPRGIELLREQSILADVYEKTDKESGWNFNRIDS